MEMLGALRLTAAHEAESTVQQMRDRFAAAQQLQNEVLPAARKLLADTQASYERGETEIQRLFRARERLTNLETASLEALAEYHLARIRWQAALGLP
jgi:cobalt-zinc-cadmium efflux system outer membrane protein